MQPTSPVDPVPPSRWWRALALAVAAAALGLAFFSRTWPLAADLLDPSWKAVLGHDFAEGRQFGRDTVFTCGPLHYFIIDQPPYVPALFTVAIALRLLFGLAAAAVLVAAGSRVRPWPLRVLGITALLALIPYPREILHFAAVGVIPLTLAASRRPTLSGFTAAGLYAGAVAFTKHNLLAVVLVAMVCAIAVFAHRRGLARGALAAAIFAAEVVLVWVLARQDPRNLPAYFTAAVDFAAGYADAMASPQPGERMLLTLGTAIAFAAAALAAIVARARRREDLDGALATLSMLAAGGIAVKLGLVRADDGHRCVTNGVLMLLGIALPSGGSRPADVLRGLVVASATVGLLLATGPFGSAAARAPDLVRKHVTQALDELFHPSAARAWHDAVRADFATRNALPELAAAIGSEPVDLVGSSQGVLYLAGMNVRHRPSFTDHSTLTPRLNALNAAFFERADAPRFVLLKLWGIDGRHPTVSDSGSLRALMLHYSPLRAERGYVLFERQAASAAAAAPVAVRSRHVAFGETLDVSDLVEGLVELSVEVEPTSWGRLKAALLRPPFLWIVVKPASGPERRFRISRSLVRSPFILSPFVDSTRTFLDLWGHARRDRVTAVRFEVEEGREAEVAPRLGVTVWSDAAAWQRLAAQPSTEAAKRMAFPSFRTPPDGVEPSSNVWPLGDDETQGVLAHPPSSLIWTLPAGAWRASGRYGIVPQAWEQGATDGVVFVAEVRSENAPPREILRRRLAPRSEPADREPVAFEFAFELPSAGRLLLRTEPGPADNTDSDWAWWSSIAVERAP